MDRKKILEPLSSLLPLRSMQESFLSSLPLTDSLIKNSPEVIGKDNEQKKEQDPVVEPEEVTRENTQNIEEKVIENNEEEEEKL